MTQIWPAEPDTNVTLQSGGTYNLVNPVSNGVPAGFIMLRFNLEVFNSYTGVAVQGAGELAAACAWTQVGTPPVFHAYPLLAPWDETNVTWNSYIGDWSTWTNKLGTDLGSEIMDTINMTGYWSGIDAALIQTWIDHPASNYGLALVPEGTGNTIWRTSPTPQLTFELSNTNAPQPDQPTNVTPADGAKGVSRVPTLVSSAYSGPGTHAASQWRIARDAAMSDIAWDSGADPNNLVTISVPSNTLSLSSRYYWDVRHINMEGGKSAYSDATIFDTEVMAGCGTYHAAGNAMVKYFGALQPSNFNGSVLASFWPHGASNGVHGGIVLAWFDLGVFEGFQASQDGEFTLHYGFVDVNFGDIFFSCYEVTRPWSEDTVTWENFVGADETNFWPLLGQSYGSQQAEQNSSNTWIIPQATIQKWLDNEQTNFGLAIYPDQNNANAYILTRAVGARGPGLDICIIPEPGMVAGAMLAALACVRRSRN
jgi:hypothetical protein